MSLVLRLGRGETDSLFSFDVEDTGAHVVPTYPQTITSEILKVPRLCSSTSRTPDFFSTVSAKVAVASLHSHNRFRLPTPEIVQRYRVQGVEILRTD